MIEDKYLPIGTVVMLKGGTKRVMITGFCSMEEKNNDKMYDYNGCMYPEGIISSDKTLLFNHDQIEKIYFKGFVDDEETKFKEQLNNVIKQLKDVPKNSDELDNPLKIDIDFE